MAMFSLRVVAAIRVLSIPIIIIDRCSIFVAAETLSSRLSSIQLTSPGEVSGRTPGLSSRQGKRKTCRCNSSSIVKLQTKDKESDVTMEYYYYDGELEERHGIRRRQNSSQN